ncbi:MAG: NAD(P)H-dependent oxidoreductase [Actinobacteria bacterium]|nr:NAD(P)H-dependent oxidoreductase [Actinomycetota bacterium]
MPSLLHIEVSPSGSHSVSRSVSAEFVTSWRSHNTGGTVVLRDLALNPSPHLDEESLRAAFTPEDQRTEGMKSKLAYRLELIEEIKQADEIVIATPMWNWSVPSVLKAYFDQIILKGTLDSNRAKGLIGKKITFVVAQGSSYAAGSPREGWDHTTGFLKHIASVLGSDDIEIIVAEYTLAGIAPGMEAFADSKTASISAAKQAARVRAA